MRTERFILRNPLLGIAGTVVHHMERFELLGQNGNFIKLKLVEVYGYPNKTSFFGGYDSLIELELKSGIFKARCNFNSSTGEFYKLYESLNNAYENISGKVEYSNYEKDLQFNLNFIENGTVNVQGEISNSDGTNVLSFSFYSDQSYISSSLEQLRDIISKYGNLEGV